MPETHFPFIDRYPYGERSRATGSGGGGPEGLSPGFYYIGDGADANPIAVTDPRWTSTLKFQDIGLNDKTTYETSSLGGFTSQTHALRVFASSTAISQWTATVYGEAISYQIYYSVNGTTWSNWGLNTSTPVGFSQMWFDVGNSNPGSINTLYVQLVHQDSTRFTSDPRIGDWRIS